MSSSILAKFPCRAEPKTQAARNSSSYKLLSFLVYHFDISGDFFAKAFWFTSFKKNIQAHFLLYNMYEPVRAFSHKLHSGKLQKDRYFGMGQETIFNFSSLWLFIYLLSLENQHQHLLFMQFISTHAPDKEPKSAVWPLILHRHALHVSQPITLHWQRK